MSYTAATPGPRRGRITLSPNRLVMLVALWLTLTMNLPFWHTVWSGIGGWSGAGPAFLVSLPLFVLGWLYLLLSLLAWGRLTRPVLAVLLLVSAAASYFMHSYGIVVDASMLDNVLQTDSAEALELFNPQLLGWLLGLGVLPALLLGRVELRRKGWKRELLGKLGSMLLVLACMGGTLMALYQPYASLIRNHREVRLQLVPSNVLAAAHSYVRHNLAKPAELQVVGSDAQRLQRAALSGKPRVTLLVVGETARAANFSLNGYGRPTNPELAEREVINFPRATSCGTATAVSVPCMFLDVGRSGYKDSMAGNREGLLDVLQRAGVQVLWRDNNSGCKGACDRVPSENLAHLEVAGLCEGGECHDEILLRGLADYLDGLKGDAVVVLHMKGSHGPAYYKRYPQRFETFTPVCRDNRLDHCSRDSIVNAYDNSLRYTDHVLAAAIDLLQSRAARLDSAMLYLSDHGESLGEGGLYLHGVPYAMAPDEQTHVPMLLWLSDGLQRSAGITAQCMRREAAGEVSQDNLFHSVLGLMGVRTTAYQAQRDLFRTCQRSHTALN